MIEDAEITISTQSNTLVMSKSIYNTRAGTLSKGTRDKRQHLATGYVSEFGVSVGSSKHGAGVSSEYRRCRHRQRLRRHKVIPSRGDGEIAGHGWKEKC